MNSEIIYPGAKIKQTYLGDKGLIVFLALLSAFVPLSTDLYLPALPTMTKYFQTHSHLTNLTLILFFVFFSLGTLIWGPLSDKYGRRPILLAGLVGYIIASFLCSISLNVYQLIIFRILQAAGGSVSSALATAIVKDVYEGRKRESTLALVQSMVLICPAVAPVIGALLLKITSWRGVFVTQALLGMAAFAAALAFRETLEARSSGSLIHTIGRLGVVLKNPGFTSLLIIFSMLSITFMAFISSSSYIYQDVFLLSSQVYSYYFAFNAAGMLVGPLIYLRLSARFRRFSIINACFGVIILSGILIYTLGNSCPQAFAIMLLPATIATSCTRPPSTFFMLEQQKEDAGSASSLMSSFATVMGSVGMVIVSFFPGNLVKIVGAVNIIFGMICGLMWLAATKKPFLSRVREM
ncbi:MAG: multidrug effflux MFS transporter [Tepidanaerobacteraceae bacterium]|jgi:DHA1 family bicyclomycin/chloramphenicol resistance-like MFS transporter|nr:multidrug effflux MFS transporter [Tepidanaerobacteraceae bacterium]